MLRWTAISVLSAGMLLPSGALSPSPVLAEDDALHWSLRAPVTSGTPHVEAADWLLSPVDPFILSRLETEQLGPAAPADRRTLIRRASFDLLGLPPTPEQVDEFLQDDAPDAYERLIDRLLASPFHGERWARHWLDVVRYADTNGYEYDDPRPHAWRYRDWVIQSFNDDRPYDEFVRWQIAADELVPGDLEALAATGLHRMGPLRLNAGMQDEEKNRQELLVEMTDAIGSTFLGLTMGCARCHDHKFDPIPQADYFRMQAFFAATVPRDVSLASPAEQADYVERTKRWEADVAALERQIAQTEQSCRVRLLHEHKESLPEDVQAVLSVPAAERTPAQQELLAAAMSRLNITPARVEQALTESERQTKRALEEAIRTLKAHPPPPLPEVWAVTDTPGDPPATYVLFRGEPSQKREIVQARFPVALAASLTPHDREGSGSPGPGDRSSASGSLSDAASPSDSHRRAALARWLSSADNPLTSRVIVNRLWQHHFGRGLVATPNDFGVMGQPPTHPELLDRLAIELIRHEWSLKSVHRQIVESATYRQSVNPLRTTQQADPDNDLWGRRERRRLDAESLRDSVLFVAGSLNPKAGGPGVMIPFRPEVTGLIYKGTWEPTKDPAEYDRRTIYLFVKRNLPNPLLEAFDQPSSLVTCAERTQSLHAGQALSLWNGEFIHEQARRFAGRLLGEGTPPDPRTLSSDDCQPILERAYRLALNRSPNDAERQIGAEYLVGQTASLTRDSAAEQGGPFAAALADYCLVLFNLDEFLFVE